MSGQDGAKPPRIDADAVAAHADLPAIVASYGIKVLRKGREYLAFCPFHNERTPSFTLFQSGGRWRFKCFGCGETGDAIGFIMKKDGRDFRDALRKLAEDEGLADPVEMARAMQSARERQAEADEKERRERERDIATARQIWRESRPAEGTVVEQYLRARRIRPELQGGIPVTLRFHPELRFLDQDRKGTAWVLRGMVAAVQGPDGRIVGIHRTFIKHDGVTKVELPIKKAMLGPCWGGAVRFDAAGPEIAGGAMAGGEGIETTLSVRQALREAGDRRPFWAFLSLGNMGGAILPNGVRDLTLLADADAKDRVKAEQALRRAAQAQRDRGIPSVRAARPEPGCDFNDMLQGNALPRKAAV